MKRNLILSLAIIFTMALLAPAVSYAFVSSPVVIVDNKEKKDETKTTTAADQTEKKAEATATETKACCDKANTAGCCMGANKSDVKACTGDKKTCGDAKTCTREKKPCDTSSQTDK